jgi:hypothetical protein
MTSTIESIKNVVWHENSSCRRGNRHDLQSMEKVKNNILELDSRRCRSQALSLPPLSTSAKLSDPVNIYYTTVAPGEIEADTLGAW